MKIKWDNFQNNERTNKQYCSGKTQRAIGRAAGRYNGSVTVTTGSEKVVTRTAATETVTPLMGV